MRTLYDDYKERMKQIKQLQREESDFVDEVIFHSYSCDDFKRFIDKNETNPLLKKAIKKANEILAGRKNLYKISEDGLEFGVCFDLHTIKSEMNEYGGWNNTYSKYGEIIHKTKYVNIPDSSKKILLDKMLELVFADLSGFNFLYRNIIVTPMPFTHQRTFQPVHYIASSIASRINRPYRDDILYKKSNIEAKRVQGEYKDGDFFAKYSGRPVSVLIVDDIYGEGTSLRACIKALKAIPEIQKIYYIGITKRRSNGLK